MKVVPRPTSLFDLDRAAVTFGDRRCDRQSQPGALDCLFGCRRSPEETFEETRLIVFRDPHAGIGDLDLGGVASLREPQRHGSAGRREFQGVGHEVVDHLAKPAGVAVKAPDGLSLESELDLAVGGRGSRCLERMHDQR